MNVVSAYVILQIKDRELPGMGNLEESVSKILAESQEFMRRQKARKFIYCNLKF